MTCIFCGKDCPKAKEDCCWDCSKASPKAHFDFLKDRREKHAAKGYHCRFCNKHITNPKYRLFCEKHAWIKQEESRGSIFEWGTELSRTNDKVASSV